MQQVSQTPSPLRQAYSDIKGKGWRQIFCVSNKSKWNGKGQSEMTLLMSKEYRLYLLGRLFYSLACAIAGHQLFNASCLLFFQEPWYIQHSREEYLNLFFFFFFFTLRWFVVVVVVHDVYYSNRNLLAHTLKRQHIQWEKISANRVFDNLILKPRKNLSTSITRNN